MPGESPPSMPIKETPRRRSSTVPPNAPSSSPPRRTLSARKAQPPREPADPRMDNVFSWSASSRTRFVELAALQSLVSRTPSDPAAQASKLKSWEHDADKHAAAGWRVLPSKVERDTADNFAFLAAADAGAEFVSAVCVEERSAGGLAFRLAMNEGAMNEGVPQRIVDGLNRLCKTLENAAANGGFGCPLLLLLWSVLTGMSRQERTETQT
ncbi:hypothetical protein FN846DRAFT_449073 [Sphaerosporella brunnea]|uniref:Uncharacterized protein n=1 Tax=Sphaerosporella brunnea TaxID=1250544 RepID=A0A5J5F5H3_9PEZI|nr:hypothetical protein FN846DRAFT_449073 [Sphaerosporella brunnea]